MIQHLIINACFIVGLSLITREGYILHWYRRICESVPVLNKPLITCQLCMSSIYGVLYLWLAVPVTEFGLEAVPVYLISLVVCVAIIKTVVEILALVRDYMHARVDGIRLELAETIEKINADDNNNK